LNEDGLNRSSSGLRSGSPAPSRRRSRTRSRSRSPSQTKHRSSSSSTRQRSPAAPQPQRREDATSSASCYRGSIRTREYDPLERSSSSGRSTVSEVTKSHHGSRDDGRHKPSSRPQPGSLSRFKRRSRSRSRSRSPLAGSKLRNPSHTERRLSPHRNSRDPVPVLKSEGLASANARGQAGAPSGTRFDVDPKLLAQLIEVQALPPGVTPMASTSAE
jgi:hypothetical protein